MIPSNTQAQCVIRITVLREDLWQNYLRNGQNARMMTLYKTTASQCRS
jgi:hypothetical protein